MRTHLWVRAETKPMEQRCGISPLSAEKLVEQGFRVTVEGSDQSCYTPDAFEQVGCEIAEAGRWIDAPEATFILGLKELPESNAPLCHRHIYFAHAYKEQQGWKELLLRFDQGGGVLYDLEYLEDPPGRRVATFGYWAGFSGAALAVWAWSQASSGTSKPLSFTNTYPSKDLLIDEVKSRLKTGGSSPRVMVIGAAGRCGRGAIELLDALDLDTTAWDLAETQAGGPFPEILEHDIFINGVFLSEPTPPFLTQELLARPRRLSMICDVSCDPLSPVNPLPIYEQTTTFNQPLLRITDGDSPVDLIAIDHLPSLLPTESSAYFSEQLLPYLLKLDEVDQGTWAGAKRIFDAKTARAKQV